MLTHYETQLKTDKGCDSVKKSVELTITSNEAKVGQIMRDGGTDLIRLHVTEAIATYVSLLPSSRMVTPEAIVTMGQYLTEHPDIKHLSVTELKTFFNLAFKQQRFGKLYGGFGYDTLLDWFNQFFEMRIQEVVEYREKQHTYYTQNEKVRRDRSEGDAFGGFLQDIKTIYDGQQDNTTN